MGPTSGLDLTILGGSYEVTLLGLFFSLLKFGGGAREEDWPLEGGVTFDLVCVVAQYLSLSLSNLSFPILW